MIFLISDLHGRLDFSGWQEYQNRTETEDILILLGDVRLNEPEVLDNEKFTNAILSTKKQVLYIQKTIHILMKYQILVCIMQI